MMWLDYVDEYIKMYKMQSRNDPEIIGRIEELEDIIETERIAQRKSVINRWPDIPPDVYYDVAMRLRAIASLVRAPPVDRAADVLRQRVAEVSGLE